MIINYENSVIFLRGADVKQYIQDLEKINYELFDTIAEIANILNIPISENNMIEDYIRAVREPTVLGQILIDEGKWSKEECTRNFTRERIIKDIKEYGKIKDAITKASLV